MDWKDILIESAKDKRMCKDNFLELVKCENKERAIALYKKSIDWALENEYPSLNDLYTYFSECEKYGIFVGKCLSDTELSDLLVYVIHACTGKITVSMNEEKANIPMLYIANGCSIGIECTQNNEYPIMIPVYVFGNNSVRIIEHTNTETVVNFVDNDTTEIYTKNAIFRIYKHD